MVVTQVVAHAVAAAVVTHVVAGTVVRTVPARVADGEGNCGTVGRSPDGTATGRSFAGTAAAATPPATATPIAAAPITIITDLRITPPKR